MNLKDYIEEAISSGKHKFTRSISKLDKNIGPKEFVELLEEMGYQPEEGPFSFFECGEYDRYRIVEMNNTKRVLIKNTQKQEGEYYRVVFRNNKIDVVKRVYAIDVKGEETSVEEKDIRDLIDYINRK